MALEHGSPASACERSDVPRLAAFLIASSLLLIVPADGRAFSVTAHQGVVDQAWGLTLVPLIRQRFPNATDRELTEAHAYARGGSISPILVLSARESFVFRPAALRSHRRFRQPSVNWGQLSGRICVRLGMLGHYEAPAGIRKRPIFRCPSSIPSSSRNTATPSPMRTHPRAPTNSIRCAAGRSSQRNTDLFEHSIDFKVPRDALERAFAETYGLQLNDLFDNYDIAIYTYRWGFRTIINEGTGIAWALYRKDIESNEPGVTSKEFVREISRGDFERQFGKAFLEPGYLPRFVGFLGTLVPDVGPLKRLPFKPLPDSVQKLYFRAYRHASERYVHEVAAICANKAWLENINLDTGRADKSGEYAPADEAWVDLLELHDKSHFANVRDDLASDFRAHFRDRNASLAFEDSESKRQGA